MKLTSNIKKSLGEELMRLCAAVCDSRKYDSNQDKMVAVAKLLKMYEVNYSVTGGATNRLAVLIDGYVYKFALDTQGFKDNFIEYAISSELQPYVTKTYETNGYILVAEYVNQMNLTMWRERRDEILKILSTLANHYLLGDVGYTEKNYMNWGTRDDGSLVILDYAYCHRATETLFKCERCGEGLLTYDVNYTMLMCTNRANGCNATYTYNERKTIQGDQVDIDMIEDMKNNHSIALPTGVMDKEVELSEALGEVFDDDVVVVHNEQEYREYLREEESRTMLIEDYDSSEALDLLIDIANAKDATEKEQLLASLGGITFAERPKRRVIFSDDYELDEEDDAYEGPDPVIFYDATYGYPNSFESLGLDEDGAMKKRFYRERAQAQTMPVYHEEEEDNTDMKELTVDDLIDMIAEAERKAAEQYAIEEPEDYGDDDSDFPPIPVTKSREDGSDMSNINPELLLDGKPVVEE